MTMLVRRARRAGAFACCSLASFITAQQPSEPVGKYEVDPAYANEVADVVSQITRREVVALDCPPAETLTFNQTFECRGTFVGGGGLHVEMETFGVREVNIIRINGEVPSAYRRAPPRFERALGTVAAIASLLAAILAAFTLRAFLKLYRGQYVTEPLVPLAAQEVSFTREGSYVLYLRGRRRIFPEFSTKSIGVWDPLEGAWVRSWDLTLLNFRSSGITTVQRTLRGFQVPRPGVYTLAVGGLEQERNYEDRLILGNAKLLHLFALLIVTILGFVFAVFGLIIAVVTLNG